MYLAEQGADRLLVDEVRAQHHVHRGGGVGGGLAPVHGLGPHGQRGVGELIGVEGDVGPAVLDGLVYERKDGWMHTLDSEPPNQQQLWHKKKKK